MRILPLLTAGALVLPAVLEGQVRRGDDSVFTWTGRMATGSTLSVRTHKGRISVRPATGDLVEVRGERHGRWSRGRVEPVEFHMLRDGADIVVCAIPEDADCDLEGIRHRHRGSNASEESADFTISLPRGVRLVVGTGNGNLDVTAVGSDVNAASGNGDVEIRGTSGSVRASTGNGRVTVQDARGPVKASTGNGRVIVRTSAGPVQATSGNGDIDVSMGRLASEDNMTFTTGNGRISLTLPPDFAGEIEASQPHGEIRSDFPITVSSGRIGSGRLRGTIGSGGVRRIRLSTGNGQIELRRG
jgi:hypothetical protein